MGVTEAFVSVAVVTVFVLDESSSDALNVSFKSSVLIFLLECASHIRTT